MNLEEGSGLLQGKRTHDPVRLGSGIEGRARRDGTPERRKTSTTLSALPSVSSMTLSNLP